MLFALVLLVTPTLPVAASEKTLFVDAEADCSGDGSPERPYCRIQDAIDAAEDGDRVLVGPGLYFESIRIDKRVEVSSRCGREETTLFGDGRAPRVVLGPSTSRETVLEGFRIRGNGSWGGVLCEEGASPTIRSCIIANNSSNYLTSGVTTYGGAPLIDDCIIRGNGALGGVLLSRPDGAEIRDCRISDNGDRALEVHSGTATIRNTTMSGVAADLSGSVVGIREARVRLERCHIVDNIARGVEAGYGSEVVLVDCFISRNSDGALWANNETQVTIVNSLLTDNAGEFQNLWLRGSTTVVRILNSTISGNDGPILLETGTTLEVEGSILWSNGSREIEMDSANVSIQYSLITGDHPGLGNLSSDPLFRDADGGDYRLSCKSPCVDTGPRFPSFELPRLDQGGRDLRVLGKRIDIGADEAGTDWQVDEHILARGSVRFEASAPTSQAGQLAEVFLSREDGDAEGLRVPRANGRRLGLGYDALFGLWLALPRQHRRAEILGCESPPTVPAPVPNLPIGERIFYAGVTWDLVLGGVSSVSETKAFEVW